MDSDSILVKSLYNCKSSPEIVKSVSRTRRENSQLDHDLSTHHRHIEEEFDKCTPSLKRQNRNESIEHQSRDESFGPYQDRVVDRFKAIGGSVSPSSE